MYIRLLKRDDTIISGEKSLASFVVLFVLKVFHLGLDLYSRFYSAFLAKQLYKYLVAFLGYLKQKFSLRHSPVSHRFQFYIHFNAKPVEPVSFLFVLSDFFRLVFPFCRVELHKIPERLVQVTLSVKRVLVF